jgi:hypothetical protein
MGLDGWSRARLHCLQPAVWFAAPRHASADSICVAWLEGVCGAGARDLRSGGGVSCVEQPVWFRETGRPCLFYPFLALPSPKFSVFFI